MNRPLKVLLAEDNPVNQKVALRLLERLGYAADVVRDGMEVIEALTYQFYDVVLMDMNMPRLDGLATTRRICREWHPAIRPRIVAITASTTEEDRRLCLEAGMDDYVSKPLRLDELSRVLRDCRPLELSQV